MGLLFVKSLRPSARSCPIMRSGRIPVWQHQGNGRGKTPAAVETADSGGSSESNRSASSGLTIAMPVTPRGRTRRSRPVRRYPLPRNHCGSWTKSVSARSPILHPAGGRPAEMRMRIHKAHERMRTPFHDADAAGIEKKPA